MQHAVTQPRTNVERSFVERPFRVDGEWWVMQVGVAQPDDAGDCFTDTKTIQVKTRDSLRGGLHTAIHETLHAVYPFLDEAPIAAGELAIAEAIDCYLAAVGGRIVFTENDA